MTKSGGSGGQKTQKNEGEGGGDRILLGRDWREKQNVSSLALCQLSNVLYLLPSVVYGHRFVTLPCTVDETLQMAHIAAHIIIFKLRNVIITVVTV